MHGPWIVVRLLRFYIQVVDSSNSMYLLCIYVLNYIEVDGAVMLIAISYEWQDPTTRYRMAK